MDRSRKATREGNEVTLQHKSQHETLLVDELNEDKVTQLLASIEQLKQTPSGAAELQRRTSLFGECKRIEGENTGEFYSRLHQWLDRYMPPKKSPLHPPRQTGD